MLGAAALGHEFLHRGVDREHDVLARLTVVARNLAHDAAVGVHLDLAGSGGAAQFKVLGFFDAGLADAKIGQFEQRIAGQFLFRHRGDIAKNVRRGRAGGVEPQQPLVDRDAR